MNEQAPRVLISYAQGDDAHAEWVRKLASRLRDDGVEAIIDQYEPRPSKPWQDWINDEFKQARWILLACTATYLEYFIGQGPKDKGRGVRWEANLIQQELSANKLENKRFIPILPTGSGEKDIPEALRGFMRFEPDAHYAEILAVVKEQPAISTPEVERKPEVSLSMAARDIPNPYPGFAAFTEDQARHFFGRTKDIPRVMAPLRAGRFACVSGSSGTGKSSLVAAGVLPALRLELQAPGRFCVRFTPRSDPLAEFAKAIGGYLPEERLFGREPREQRIAGKFRTDQAMAMARYFAPPAPVLIFADQFEELFTQTPEGERACFKTVFDALRGAASLYVVLTLRSEFFAQLVDWLGGEVLDNRLVPLSAIDDDARYRELISRPATDCGVPIEEVLVTELAATARGMAGSLPLLALTLQRLFARRDPALGITLVAYEATGGLAESVRSATRAVDEEIDADPTLATACERLFAALATAAEGIPTRHTAEVAPLRTDPSIGRLIDDLRAQGLLADPDDAHVEIAHESLFAYWPRLKAWCERHILTLARRRDAQQAAQDWHKAAGNDSAANPRRTSDLLRWGWERQKPAIEAMVALVQRPLLIDPDYADPGIHAWRALEGELDEPLKSFLYPEPLRLLDELASDDTPHDRREVIGRRLNQMPDPRRGAGLDDKGLPDIVWESIEAGEVILETDPPQSFPVAPFLIARYPVTWAQYRAFVEADDGYRNDHWWEALKQDAQPGKLRWAFDNHPVINVSWYDAVAFCHWLSDRLGLASESAVRLPTEWEWQWVAQAGRADLEYPWGHEWNDARLNSGEAGIGRTTAIGLYPLGCPEGKRVLDLTGNVWEWCLNEYGHPDNCGLAGDAGRMLRGGAWHGKPDSCRASRRSNLKPDYRYDNIGFRVCRSSPIDPLGAGALDTGVQDR